MPEQHHRDDALLGLLDEGPDVDFADQVLPPEIEGAAGKDRQRDDTGHDVGDIEGQRPPPDLERQRQTRAGHELAAIGKPDGEAGDQDEGLGRIRKADVLVGQVFEILPGNVVDEDRQKAERPQYVEARVALLGNRAGGCRRVRSAPKCLLQHAVWYPGSGAPAPPLLKRAPDMRLALRASAPSAAVD
ncbi:hypothetical protein D3C72_1683340 [compost metagenome]